MPLFALDKEIHFPPVHMAEPDGMLAIGGDLSPERLLEAYRNGIFPWYQGDCAQHPADIIWWSPDPRFVLFPSELKINKSVRSIINKNEFLFTTNKAFGQVIRHCKEISRPGQEGTWITDEVEDAYCKMHELGFAVSAEAWKDEKLVGGLYGIKVGNVFFGESMFSIASNASRFAFVKFIQSNKDLKLVDCQVYTSYLESFGARMIERTEFISLLNQNLEPK